MDGGTSSTQRRRGPARGLARAGAEPPSPAQGELLTRLDGVGVRDAARLRRRVLAARGERALDAVAGELAAAELALVERAASVPVLTYPDDLPVAQRRSEIAAAVREHQVVVVAGETGSGKTTQLPKILLGLGRGVRGMVGHTQPRRIAARAVAERVAEELGEDGVGGVVGYAVRFTDQVGPRSLVKLMTDGILLAEVGRDRDLLAYDTIVIDEAHERSLTIDFLLGYLHQLLPRRPDLKVVITSATIDPQRFADHFAPAVGPVPVIEVSGRTYPVQVRYRPLVEEAPAPRAATGEEGEDAEEDAAPLVVRDQVEAIVDAVGELEAEPPGDVLVFLSGEREIRDTADALGALDLPRTEVVPLYARLSAAEQHRVFTARPRGVTRRIVLATNVAETSLTVPGIRYVVDPGTARISRYSLRSKVQRLPIEPISRASADQRAGRCGRVADGVCIRLYSEEDYQARPRFTDPEVVRTNLAAVLLRMLSLDLGDLEAFPFLDPPDRRQVRDGLALLHELGALDAEDGPRRLTPVGRRLADLPIDPRLARMVHEAERLGVLPEVLVVVAALSVQDPRERPGPDAAAGAREAAAAAHARFADEHSDFLAWVNLWSYLRARQGELTSSAFRRMCRAEHLHHLRVREWQDLHGQLRGILQRGGSGGSGARVGPVREGEDLVGVRDAVHQALLAGLLSHLGLKDAQATRRPQEFLGARGTRFAIVPGSALAKRPPAWVVAGELVETSRLWGRTVARIDPEWVERTGAHLLRRTYSEPRWERRRAAAVATERATLYGLPVITGRTVDYARIDPEVSRDLFIRHALVEGEWTTHHRFLAENRARLEEAGELEARVRRRGLVADEEALVGLYDARVPREVTSARTFDRWWKDARRTDPGALTFTVDDLLAGAEELEDVDEAFPLTWRTESATLDLSYRFSPGTEDDGVVVHVPVSVLGQLSSAGFDAQVPGLRLELVTALLRGLPKPLRVQLVPVPDTARALVEHLERSGGTRGDQPFLDAVTEAVRRVRGVVVPHAAWSWDKVPAHLRATFVVEGEDGRELARGADLDVLREQVRPQVREAVSRALAAGPQGSSGAGARQTASLQRTGLGRWPDDLLELPAQVETTTTDGRRVVGYPAVVDEGATAGVAVLESRAAQRREHAAGVRRLLRLALPTPTREVLDSLDGAGRLALARAPHGSVAALVDDVTAAVVDDLVRRESPEELPRTAGAFAALLATLRPQVVPAVLDLVRTTSRVLGAAAEVQRRLDAPADLRVLASLTDARAQLAALVHPGFVAGAGAGRVPDLLRYLRALQRRLDALPADAARDRDRTGVVQRLAQEVDAAVAALPPERRGDDDVRAVRWMLEELRVSLFAQTLGTAGPVSEQRVRRALAALRGAAA